MHEQHPPSESDESTTPEPSPYTELHVHRESAHRESAHQEGAHREGGFDLSSHIEQPRPLKSVSGGPVSESTFSRLLWVLTFLMFILLMVYLAPYVIENIQYSITRGRQRAEYELAGEGLKAMPLPQLSKAYQMVSQRVWPSVVHINTSTNSEQTEAGIHGSRRPIRTGQGSGFIVDKEGYILTNHHVIEGANAIEVALSDGRTLDAQIVGVDKESDIALLKIKAADSLIAIEWGNSDQLEMGAMVWAVGSPFGLERSISFGILSGKHRVLDEKHRSASAGNAYQDFLQTDAALNPGNSGGPLVDVRGRVVGVNTAIVGQVYSGISFAIPSSVARNVYESLKASGSVERGWLGVSMAEISKDLAEELGLTKPEGVFVRELVRNRAGVSPAKLAGMKFGDVIIRWNDEKVANPANLSVLVAKTSVGSKASVVVFRDGQEVALEVKVTRRLSQTE